MTNRDAAVMAMIGISVLGFLVAEGEKNRIRWVQAMRRCLIRMADLIRYEQPDISALLLSISLGGTKQERELTTLLHGCAERMKGEKQPLLLQIFTELSTRLAPFGVLSEADRAPFERLLGELGNCGLYEQLRLIDESDELLRQREEALRNDGTQKTRLIKTLSVCGGAVVFLVLI